MTRVLLREPTNQSTFQVTLKGSSSSGWYAPPKGSHTGEAHRAAGSGKSGPEHVGLTAYMRSQKRANAPIQSAIEDKAREWVVGQLPDGDADTVDVEVQMLTDAMALDEARFIRYGTRIGLDDPEGMAKEFFKERKAVDKAQARAMAQTQERLTYKNPVTGNASYQASMGTELFERTSGLVGESPMHAVAALNDLGVHVVNTSGASQDEVHQVVSQLVNLANADPRLGHVIRDELKEVRFERNNVAHPTATMSAGYQTIHVHPANAEFRSPLTLVHELGHVHSYNVDFDDIVKAGFTSDKRHVSMYGWTNYDEEFAETFVSVIGRDAGVRNWVPAKYDLIDQSLGGAS